MRPVERAFETETRLAAQGRASPLALLYRLRPKALRYPRHKRSREHSADHIHAPTVRYVSMKKRLSRTRHAPWELEPRQISLMAVGPGNALPAPKGQLTIGRQFIAGIDAPNSPSRRDG